MVVGKNDLLEQVDEDMDTGMSKQVDKSTASSMELTANVPPDNGKSNKKKKGKC